LIFPQDAELLIVKDIDTANIAISRIVDDGEGSSLSAIKDSISGNLSHFHSLLEVYMGCKLKGVV
jgi:Ferritin-like